MLPDVPQRGIATGDLTAWRQTIHEDVVGDAIDFDTFQVHADARTRGAIPVFDAEERAMSGTDDLAAVHGQKPRVFPIERRADMGAIVEISEDRAAFTDDE